MKPVTSLLDSGTLNSEGEVLSFFLGMLISEYLTPEQRQQLAADLQESLVDYYRRLHAAPYAAANDIGDMLKKDAILFLCSSATTVDDVSQGETLLFRFHECRFDDWVDSAREICGLCRQLIQGVVDELVVDAHSRVEITPTSSSSGDTRCQCKITLKRWQHLRLVCASR